MERDLHKWLRGRLTEKRYNHSVAVERRAIFLAKLYGEDVNKASLAGLLHDCCKSTPPDEQLKIIKSRGILLDDFTLLQPQLWHPLAGSILVQDELEITDSAIVSAIALHTTGAKNMTRFEQIIYLADLTSGDRDYSDVAEIRALSEKSLTLCMLASLKFTIQTIICDGGPIVKDAWEAYNYFWKLSKETNI